MLAVWLLVLVLGTAYLAHRRTAPLPALAIVAAYLLIMGAYSHAPGWLLVIFWLCLLYTSPSPRDLSTSRMPSSA